MRRFFLLAVVAAAMMAPASAAGAQPITGSGWSWLLPSWMPHQTVDFVTPTEWWATGTSGVLLHTTDGGATWDAKLTPFDPWKFDFVDGEHGWAVTSAPLASTVDEDPRGIIWRTADGGVTWKRTMFATGGLTGIAFADPLHGCAIERAGRDLAHRRRRSHVGPSLVPDADLMAISMPDATHVWASGLRAVGYETTGAVYGIGGRRRHLDAAGDRGGLHHQRDHGDVPGRLVRGPWELAPHGERRPHLDVVPDPAEDRQWSLLATAGDGSHA